MRRILWLLPVFALVVGCATTPDPVRDAEVEPLAVAAVRGDPNAHGGARVRWGGSIVDVRNRADKTVVEVLSRPLKSTGAPEPDGLGQGRFRARVTGFLDPSDYSPGRWMTVVGQVAGSEKGQVGDFPYVFPLVDVEVYRLWRTREEIEPPPRPYYYDPWWGPWGPWSRPWWGYPYWW